MRGEWPAPWPCLATGHGHGQPRGGGQSSTAELDLASVSHPFVTTAPSADTQHPSYESEVFGFVLLWCRMEQSRVGEVALLPPFDTMKGGRGVPGLRGFLRFGRHRPGGPPVIEPREYALLDPAISRELFTATADAVGIDFVLTGTSRTYVNGRELVKDERVKLGLGDLVLLRDAALLLVVRRQRIMPALSYWTELHPFGAGDSTGTVGESPLKWAVRDDVALIASRRDHALLLGDSGTGKEALAFAIHRLSPRAKRLFNPANAAAIPVELREAEIFGNIANYPNVGMAAREGILAVADGGTAFLDEIGAASEKLQQALLRAMESRDFRRLGEAKPRLLDIILVAATSAPEASLLLDFRKRFGRIIHLPALRDIKEDIPLLVRHLLLLEAARYPADMARFLERDETGVYPRVSADLIAALVQHALPGNVRDLYNFLVLAIADSKGDVVELTPRLRAEMQRSIPPRSSSEEPSAPGQAGKRTKCTKDEIVAALEEAGSVAGAAKLLGVARRTFRNWVAEYGLTPKEE